MLLLLLLYCFDLFVDSIHNVPPQEEVANLWHKNESKANVGIWAFTRYATFKIYDEFQSAFIPCTNIIYVLQCVAQHPKINLNQMFIGQTTSSLP
jgi:hypothetical protein